MPQDSLHSLIADPPCDVDVALVSAKTKFGYPISTYDDGFGPLWVFRNTYGIYRVVRCMTLEDAYGIDLDEKTPISGDDLQEALNLMNPEHVDYDQDIFDECYGFQPNATDSGIVDKDINGEYIDELTEELASLLEITLELRFS